MNWALQSGLGSLEDGERLMRKLQWCSLNDVAVGRA